MTNPGMYPAPRVERTVVASWRVRDPTGELARTIGIEVRPTNRGRQITLVQNGQRVVVSGLEPYTIDELITALQAAKAWEDTETR